MFVQFLFWLLLWVLLWVLLLLVFLGLNVALVDGVFVLRLGLFFPVVVFIALWIIFFVGWVFLLIIILALLLICVRLFRVLLLLLGLLAGRFLNLLLFHDFFLFWPDSSQLFRRLLEEDPVALINEMGEVVQDVAPVQAIVLRQPPLDNSVVDLHRLIKGFFLIVFEVCLYVVDFLLQINEQLVLKIVKCVLQQSFDIYDWYFVMVLYFFLQPVVFRI